MSFHAMETRAKRGQASTAYVAVMFFAVIATAGLACVYVIPRSQQANMMLTQAVRSSPTSMGPLRCRKQNSRVAVRSQRHGRKLHESERPSSSRRNFFKKSVALLLLSQGTRQAFADPGDSLPEPIRKTFIKKVPKQVLDARRLRKLEDAVDVFEGLDDLLELEQGLTKRFYSCQFEDAMKLLRDPKVKYLRGNLRESNKDYICGNDGVSPCINAGEAEKIIEAIESFDKDLKKNVNKDEAAPTVDALRDSAEKINEQIRKVTDIVRERTPKDVPEEFVGTKADSSA
eukprot:jgi/Bigna1/80421/fgenesh1_pg.71_\